MFTRHPTGRDDRLSGCGPHKAPRPSASACAFTLKRAPKPGFHALVGIRLGPDARLKVAPYGRQSAGYRHPAWSFLLSQHQSAPPPRLFLLGCERPGCRAATHFRHFPGITGCLCACVAGYRVRLVLLRSSYDPTIAHRGVTRLCREGSPGGAVATLPVTSPARALTARAAYPVRLVLKELALSAGAARRCVGVNSSSVSAFLSIPDFCAWLCGRHAGLARRMHHAIERAQQRKWQAVLGAQAVDQQAGVSEVVGLALGRPGRRRQ